MAVDDLQETSADGSVAAAHGRAASAHSGIAEARTGSAAARRGNASFPSPAARAGNRAAEEIDATGPLIFRLVARHCRAPELLLNEAIRRGAALSASLGAGAPNAKGPEARSSRALRSG
jgi:hypothetical protein